MKKILLLTLLTNFLIAGCTTSLNYNKETDITADSYTLLFSASDEGKITVNSAFPNKKEELVGSQEAYTDYVDDNGNGCLCLGNCGGTCHKVTDYKYYNLACLTEKSIDNNPFDNADHVFYTRYLLKPNFPPMENGRSGKPFCGSEFNADSVEESFSATFEKRKDGKVLSYILKPNKRIVKSEWFTKYIPYIIEPDTTIPNNDQELQKKTNVMDYVLNYPVDLGQVMKDSISVVYDPQVTKTVKKTPSSIMNNFPKKANGSYLIGEMAGQRDCSNRVKFTREETDYKFSVIVKLCKIDNTESTKVIFDKAYITLKNAKKVDLTNLSSHIDKIFKYIK